MELFKTWKGVKSKKADREFKNLKIEIEDRIALLTLNQPEVLNALNQSTMEELEEVFHKRLAQDDVGAVIVTGAGDKAFAAGADIKELAALDPLEARVASRQGHRILEVIEGFSRPVIAAINGFCLGGGCELALACHIRIAAESAQIGLPEVKLGLIPGYGGTQRLPRLIGEGRAMEMVTTGRMIDAAEAHRVGLVNRVCEPEELMGACVKLAAKIAANGPIAVRYAMEAVNRGLTAGRRAGRSSRC